MIVHFWVVLIDKLLFFFRKKRFKSVCFLDKGDLFMSKVSKQAPNVVFIKEFIKYVYVLIIDQYYQVIIEGNIWFLSR